MSPYCEGHWPGCSQPRSLRSVLVGVPWDTDPEMEICLQEGQWEFSQERHLEGSEGSRTGQEEKWSCDAVTTKASANPTGNFWSWDGLSKLAQVKAGRLGLCTIT